MYRVPLAISGTYLSSVSVESFLVPSIALVPGLGTPCGPSIFSSDSRLSLVIVSAVQYTSFGCLQNSRSRLGADLPTQLITVTRRNTHGEDLRIGFHIRTHGIAPVTQCLGPFLSLDPGAPHIDII